MANFNTHLLGAAAASGVMSSTLLLTGLFSPLQGMLLWATGTLGGLLPDLDADTSPTLKGLFTALGILAAFICLFSLIQFALLAVWGMMAGIFIVIRFGALKLFAELTEHRGAFHSLLATATFGLGTAFLCWRFLHLSIDLSWAMGLMMSFGYLTHLILDECFAVNLSNLEFKQSFGTALKPVSLSNWWASLLFLACGLYFAWATPQPQRLDTALQTLLSHPERWISQPLARRV
ncbi:MAG: metal-dependent hydrolase [Hahellaceae bacterium]|nr:metal-dependent hydrolase [Hahellaceae bacterium]MCP5169777.1 metal-dependent hydrolase [Hahellaceae bacterium]